MKTAAKILAVIGYILVFGPMFIFLGTEVYKLIRDTPFPEGFVANYIKWWTTLPGLTAFMHGVLCLLIALVLVLKSIKKEAKEEKADE